MRRLCRVPTQAGRGAETDAELGAPEIGAEGVLTVRRSHNRGATTLCAVYAREALDLVIKTCNITITPSMIEPTVIKPAA